MNGTVAPVLAQRLREEGHIIVAWKRNEVPPDDRAAVEHYVAWVRADALCHLATGSPEWADSLARSGVRLLYTGSVSIFSGEQRGPFTVDAEPQPNDDYGRYKLECERRIIAANSRAVVARIGWQIGDAAGSNNMVDYLTRTNAEQGSVDASENWLPACSFLADTAAALAKLLCNPDAHGVYHLDGNPGLSFFEIAQRLNKRLGSRWNIRPAAKPDQDQRLVDTRMSVAPITRRI